MPRQLRLVLIGTLIIAAIVVGIIAATQLNLMPRADNGTTESGVTITDIALGVPTDGMNARTLNQKPRYYNDEQLALRLTANAPASYRVTVRLVNEQNQVLPLTPSQLTLAPGTDGHCCWTIPDGGEYLFQVVRPDGVTTSLDLTIRERRGQAPSGL